MKDLQNTTEFLAFSAALFEGLLPATIIDLSLLGVAQDFIGECDPFELYGTKEEYE